jgi:hypothetical protein
MIKPFALADPVPLTVAIFMTTSFGLVTIASLEFGRGLRWILSDFIAYMWNKYSGLLHVPRTGWASLCAQTAMHAQVFILNHDPIGLRQIVRYI